MEALRDFVRKEASGYLKQPNVTSVGVGYKITDGKPTPEISIQFTVGRKVAPEALEALDAAELPKTVTIRDGDATVTVPTDVIERTFEVGAKAIAMPERLVEASPRKSAVNPVSPGVSIGHPTISAGTAGCVVYDAKTGAPYILSNWHVLNGSAGKVGDDIVQPGRHDDNRVEQNIAGKLVRSHLGVAGDCAIATIDRRRLSSAILELGVEVKEIGEPELGDRVVKSGRTTDVTYGIVRRVHVVTKINYGDAGEHEIGGFEIGPDPDRPARNGEISMGGDSGSAWVFLRQGRPTGMMLGLHFAGEVGDEPEHALACYAGSVFEKLGILPAPAEHPVVETVREGYDSRFLGVEIPAPAPARADVQNDLLSVSGETVFDYTHFSLAMSKVRKFARWVAWNIDGGSIKRISRRGIPFRKDPNLPADAQVGDELYSGNSLDRGHIARRQDLLWGTQAEAARANKDSFFFTNITPQHEAFNQSGAGGIWGSLENAIFSDVEVENLKVSVMGGPIFSDSDPTYRGVQLPKDFWKIIYFKEAGQASVTAKGYVLSQKDLISGLEALELPEFAVYEVPISQISEMTGLAFQAGSGEAAPRGSRRRRRESLEEVTAIRRISSVSEVLG